MFWFDALLAEVFLHEKMLWSWLSQWSRPRELWQSRPRTVTVSTNVTVTTAVTVGVWQSRPRWQSPPLWQYECDSLDHCDSHDRSESHERCDSHVWPLWLWQSRPLSQSQRHYCDVKHLVFFSQADFKITLLVLIPDHVNSSPLDLKINCLALLHYTIVARLG